MSRIYNTHAKQKLIGELARPTAAKFSVTIFCLFLFWSDPICLNAEQSKTVYGQITPQVGLFSLALSDIGNATVQHSYCEIKKKRREVILS